MKILVAYDSVFGNTEKIARAIGAALGAAGAVEVARVGELGPERLLGLELLVLGSPTRAFSATPATRDFVRALPRQALQGVRVAAFDTRADLAEVHSSFLNLMVKLFGYAAEPLARALVRKGGSQAAAPAGFLVQGTEGPLKVGEEERAARWAAGML